MMGASQMPDDRKAWWCELAGFLLILGTVSARGNRFAQIMVVVTIAIVWNVPVKHVTLSKTMITAAMYSVGLFIYAPGLADGQLDAVSGFAGHVLLLVAVWLRWQDRPRPPRIRLRRRTAATA
jgi:hypothetical protein